MDGTGVDFIYDEDVDSFELDIDDIYSDVPMKAILWSCCKVLAGMTRILNKD